MTSPSAFVASALAVLLVAGAPAVAAIDTTPYAWQFPFVTGITGAGDLQAELQEQVQRILDAGHLAPLSLRYADQLDEAYFVYQEPGRVIATLAWAYPYLTPAQQTAVRAYVTAELADARFTPWGTYPLPRTTGTRRELHPMDKVWNETSTMGQYRPSVHTLYGLWLYAYRTGDWARLQPYWSNLKAMYSSRASQGNLYGTMSAHVAMARMADHFADATARSTALANLQTQLDAGLSFSAIEANARSLPQTWSAPYAPMYDPRKDGLVYHGWMFLELSPELGRYLKDNVQAATLARHAEGKQLFPLWWLHQAPYFCRWTGDEGVGLANEVIGMMAPIERWVVGADAATLRGQMASVPTGIGDSYWIEALVQAIEATGTLTWQDVRTAVPPDTAAPSVPLNLTGSVLGPDRVELTWNASTDDRAVIAYRLRRDGTGVGTTPDTVLEDSGLNASTRYTYTVTAVDGAGNESGPSNSVVLSTQADSTPPQLAITSPASGSVVSSATLTVTGTASDNVSVVEVRWDDGLGHSGACTGTDSWTAAIPLTPGSLTLTFTARDGAGNTAQATLPVTYTPPAEPDGGTSADGGDGTGQGRCGCTSASGGVGLLLGILLLGLGSARRRNRSALLALPLCLLAAGEARAQGTNLLANGTFEAGNLTGWTASGATASNLQAHTGAWSARFVNNQGMEALIPTTPGRFYKLTGWVKIVSESGSDWGGFHFQALSSDWQSLADTGPMLLGQRGGEWFKATLIFLASTSQTRISIAYFGGAGRQQTVHVDDVMAFLKPATNTPPTVTASLTPTDISSLPLASQTFSVAADDPDGAIARIDWDFGDGAHAQQASGSRRVAVPGSYVARVRVSDDDGAVVTQAIPWTAASPGLPTVAFGATPGDGEGVARSPATLTGSATGSGITVRLTTDRGESGAVTGSTSWSASVPLRPGLNRVLAQVTDASGRVVTAERRLRLVPPGPLGVSALAESAPSVERWEVLEVTLNVDNSAATHPQFPYDPSPAPGLGWVDGISVDGLFTPDNWATVYRRPGFLRQPVQRQLKSNMEWLQPSGAPVWTVRFAPPTPGNWLYRIEVREAKGMVRSAIRGFTVVPPALPTRHGPLRVSATDGRYFEHADCTPFLGMGHGSGADEDAFSYDYDSQLQAMGAGNQQLLRLWISGRIWGSAWQPWASKTLGYDATVPHTGLSLAAAYGDGLAALRLDAENPLVWQGWNTGHSAIVPGHTYRLRVRWRTDGVTGPATAGQPYGLAVRWVGWPELATITTHPLALRHVNGDTPWHVAETTFTATGGATQLTDFLANPALSFENTTGGAAYVDEVSVREVLAGGELGGELLRSPSFNSHTTFDQHRGAGLDAVLASAAARERYFKLVISEKQEWLLNHLGPEGLPDPIGNHFNRNPGTANERLHQYHWRHLFARFGAYRSVHSWELVNEEAPGPGEHFRLAAELAAQAQADGNPHLASTSTWATLAEPAWNDPPNAPLSYVDFHSYVRGTGWLEPKETLANDSARFFADYDQDARFLADGGTRFAKPIVWGEMGIDAPSGTDGEDPGLASDTRGVWLHKIIWARTGPGGVYPLYWYTSNLFGKSLHPLFGNWNRFMAGVPLTNGRYVALGATAGAGLRVLGQKDLAAGRAHLWIDNPAHTWKAVVSGTAVPAASGNIAIPMQAPGARYRVDWYDPQTGQVSASSTVDADGSGVVTLAVTNLATDTAAKLERQGVTPPPAPSCPAFAGATPGAGEGGDLDGGTSMDGGTGEDRGVDGGSGGGGPGGCGCQSAGGSILAVVALLGAALSRRRR